MLALALHTEKERVEMLPEISESVVESIIVLIKPVRRKRPRSRKGMLAYNRPSTHATSSSFLAFIRTYSNNGK